MWVQLPRRLHSPRKESSQASPRRCREQQARTTHRLQRGLGTKRRLKAVELLRGRIKRTLVELELGIQGALNVTESMEALASALNLNKVYAGL